MSGSLSSKIVILLKALLKILVSEQLKNLTQAVVYFLKYGYQIPVPEIHRYRAGPGYML